MKKLKTNINKKNFLIASIGAVCITNTLSLSTTQTVFANTTSVANTVSKMATTDVNIRANAWAGSPILDVLKLGQTIDVYNVINGWNQVYYNGQTGYIDYRYLTTISTPITSTPVVTPVTTTVTTPVIAPVVTQHTTTTEESNSEVNFNEDMLSFLTAHTPSTETKNESPEVEVIDYEALLDEIFEYNKNLQNTNNISNSQITNKEPVDNTPEEPQVVLPVTRTVITASSIRSNTLLGSAVLGMIFPGETITVTEIKDGYEKFDYNGQVGYIDSRHVR